jgi:signal transduction histidine kinase
VAAGVAAGLAAELASYRSGELDAAVADLLVGWAWIGCGAVAWERRGAGRVGRLMVAAGIAWSVGGLAVPLLYLHRGPVVHVLLSFPSGVLSRRFARVVVALAYVDGVLVPVARSATVTIVLSVLVAAAATDGYLRETGIRRRARAVSSAGAVAVAAVLGAGAVGRLVGSGIDSTALSAYEIVLVAVAAALGADFLRGRWTAAVLTGLVVDLGRLSAPFRLRDRLARALGDPSLEVGYWLGAEAGYADDVGQPVVPPAPGSERRVTPIERDGERVAILVHDPVVLQEPALLAAAAAATRIAVTNARLQAQVRASVAQVAASRRRIVEAADAQRRRLARELHDGAQRRLGAVAEHFAALSADAAGAAEARARVADAQHQLASARAELDELARGIRPAALTSGGLAVALPELAARAAVTVEVDVATGRLSAAVEAAAYFVCGEALANVAKYARASRVRIEAREDGGQLLLVVSDDGVGGADPSRGTGLRGLADRVEALGGRISVESPSGGGTRLAAEIRVG